MTKKQLILVLLLGVSGMASAGGPPSMSLFFPMQHHALPAPAKHHHSTKPRNLLKTATIMPGSLKNNVTRIARDNGWDQVVWNIPTDYAWVGKTKIVAKNLQGIFQQLLNDYPVQAVFYNGNHIVLVRPRTLQ